MLGVIMLGGGLDSTALLVHLKHQKQDLHAIHFQYGQRADMLELNAVRYWCNKLQVPLEIFTFPLGDISESAILRNSNPDTNKLEGRNVIFTMLAATFACKIGAGELYLGYHKEPDDAPFPDATEEAADAMQLCLQAAYKTPLKLLAPFKDLSRTQILRQNFVLDDELIDKTHTCYEGISGGCGKCAHCKQRATMINNLLSDLDEPLEENR